MESGSGWDRVADTILAHTLNGAVVVTCCLDWLDSQKGPAEWNRDDRVALAADGDASTGSSPVNFRYRVAAGSTQETGDAAVDDTLISR